MIYVLNIIVLPFPPNLSKVKPQVGAKIFVQFAIALINIHFLNAAFTLYEAEYIFDKYISIFSIYSTHEFHQKNPPGVTIKPSPSNPVFKQKNASFYEGNFPRRDVAMTTHYPIPIPIKSNLQHFFLLLWNATPTKKSSDHRVTPQQWTTSYIAHCKFRLLYSLAFELPNESEFLCGLCPEATAVRSPVRYLALSKIWDESRKCRFAKTPAGSSQSASWLHH